MLSSANHREGSDTVITTEGATSDPFDSPLTNFYYYLLKICNDRVRTRASKMNCRRYMKVKMNFVYRTEKGNESNQLYSVAFSLKK